ncbi:Sulfate transport system permease protein CysT [compost metagenome]
MSFAHTVGEFGLVLMIGGNIPGVTRVASIAVYNEVEALNYPAAHAYAAILCAFSFAVVLLVNLLRRRAERIA